MSQTFTHTHTLYLTINIFAAFNSYQHEQSTNINQPCSLTLSNKRIEEVQANGHVLCVSVRTAPKLIFCLSSCHPSSSACLLPAQNHSRTVCFKSLKFYESVPGPDPSLTIIHDLFDSFWFSLQFHDYDVMGLKDSTIPRPAWAGSIPPKPSIIPPMFSILPNSFIIFILARS